jgi:hypothetical protein
MTIYIVTGPPAAGKTTWVEQHAQPGDITVDYDHIAATLTPGPPREFTQQSSHVTAIARATRRAAVDEALRHRSTNPPHDTYIVHAIPDKWATSFYRRYVCEVITIDPGYEECMKRADGRTLETKQVIKDWYSARGAA